MVFSAETIGHYDKSLATHVMDAHLFLVDGVRTASLYIYIHRTQW
jgi:hypothetical protein